MRDIKRLFEVVFLMVKDIIAAFKKDEDEDKKEEDKNENKKE